jgi:hypothetical protein
MHADEAAVGDVPAHYFVQWTPDTPTLSPPADLSEQWMQQQLDTLQLQLNAVDSRCPISAALCRVCSSEKKKKKKKKKIHVFVCRLTRMIRESYGSFVEAMHEIRLLEQTATSTGVTATNARVHLRAVQGDLIAPGLQLLCAVRRGRRCGAAVALLERVAEQRTLLEEARAALRDERFGDCLRVAATVEAQHKQQQTACKAEQLMAAEAVQLREEASAALRRGEGYLCRVTREDQWSADAFAKYYSALLGAGDDMATVAARLSVVHRTLLRLADKAILHGLQAHVEKEKSHPAAAGVAQPTPVASSSSSTLGGQQKLDRMKELFNAIDPASYLAECRRCCNHVLWAMRLQCLITQYFAANSPPEHATCMTLRNRIWAELSRRVNAGFASKAVYGLSYLQLIEWYRLGMTMAAAGQDFGKDTSVEAKMQKSLNGVLARWARSTHAKNLTHLRELLCAEPWSSSSEVAPARNGVKDAVMFVFDPLVHSVSLVKWINPLSAVSQGESAGAKEDDEDEEEPSALRTDFVEEDDDDDEPAGAGSGADAKNDNNNNNNIVSSKASHNRRPSGTDLKRLRKSGAASGKDDDGAADDVPDASSKNVACESGQFAISCFRQYHALMEHLPSMTLILSRSTQSLWRYYVLTVWQFFVEQSNNINVSSKVEVSDGLAAVLEESRKMCLSDVEGASQGSNPFEGGVSLLADLFGESVIASRSNSAAAVQREESSSKLRGSAVKDPNDVDYKVPRAVLNPMSAAEMDAAQTVFGMQARCVATETLQSVQGSVLSMRDAALQRLQGQLGLPRMTAFFDTEVSMLHELTDIVFDRCTTAIVAPVELARAILQCPLWCDAADSLGAPAQPSLSGGAAVLTASQPPYLQDLLKRTRQFAAFVRRANLGRSTVSSLWSYFVSCAMSGLLSGYAAVKRCDDFGRSQMLLHLTTFADECGRHTSMRPLPMLERVRSYLQAFFEKEHVMENWIAQFHYQYDEPALVNLLNVAHPKISRKDKTAALAKIKQWKGN